MRSKRAVCILISFLAVVFWIWWLPGPRVGNDFPFVSQSILRSEMNFPRTWAETGSEGLGAYRVFTLWSWPFTFISGILAHVGLGFGIQERVLLIVPFLLAGAWGIWRLGESIELSNPAKLLASLFYFLNTYVLLLIDGGQLSIGLAYGFFPISFLAVEKSVYSGLRKKILAGLAVSALGIFDIRFIFILFLLLLVRFFYEFLFIKKRLWWISSWIKTGIVISLILVGVNLYWLFPLIRFPLSSGTYAVLTGTSFAYFTSLGHSLLLLAPHWFRNKFGDIISLRTEFIFIPILVFLAPILRPKNKIVGFWVLVALLSVFLTKGSLEPLPKVYPWLFNNIPGFSLFRDSTKFFFLIALSYSILIGVTVDEISKRLGSHLRFKFLLAAFLSGYFLFLIRPVLFNQMTGTLSNPPMQKEYSQVADFLANDAEFGRIFWLPAIVPLGYASIQHPAVEAARLYQKRPFAVGIRGVYETFNFLREAPFMGEIFDVAGISYIVDPYLNPNRDDLGSDNIRYYYTFLNQLSERPWLSKISNFSIPIFKTKKHQDRFFIAPNIWWVIGSDSIYNDATKSANLSLSRNALIFAEERQELGVRINELPEAKIVLNKKTNLDLAAGFVNPSNLIFPARNLSLEPDKSGWWKRETADLIRWRDFLQTKYGVDNQDFDLGGGWAVGEGSLKLKVQSEKIKKGHVLLARVMESTRSGNLSFYQGDKLVGQIDTKKEGNNVRWFEVGQLSDGNELAIASEGDINIVNALAILDEREWKKYQQTALDLQRQGRVVDFDEKNTLRFFGNVTYQQIDSTKYRVHVSGLTKPALLVFSQNFDKLWKLGNQPALPVDSLLNGFRIDHDGDYVVEFEAQKYVYPGLAITGITVIVLFLLLVKARNLKS